jgi:hypothetical protein
VYSRPGRNVKSRIAIAISRIAMVKSMRSFR